MSGQDRPRALTIRELPRSERPRERLVDLGAQALSDWTVFRLTGEALTRAAR